MALGNAKMLARHMLRRCAPGLLSYYIERKWEPEPESALLPALCSKDLVSLDVGANWGQYTGPLRRLSSRVIACEPNPELATFLRRAYHVQVEQVALSNRQGQTSFVIDRDWGRSSLNTPAGAGGRTVPVSVNTLDAIAPARIGFIKIDVEGHEEEVIDGARHVIGRDRPVILVEIEERHRRGALARIPAKLIPLGYSGFFLHNGALRGMAAFKMTEHQDPANVSPRFQGRRTRGCYINNFLFLPPGSLPAHARRLADLGYSIDPLAN